MLYKVQESEIQNTVYTFMSLKINKFLKKKYFYFILSLSFSLFYKKKKWFLITSPTSEYIYIFFSRSLFKNHILDD